MQHQFCQKRPCSISRDMVSCVRAPCTAQRPLKCEGWTPLPVARVWPTRPLDSLFSRSQFSTVHTTQELFGPAGLAFIKMAAHMNHVGFSTMRCTLHPCLLHHCMQRHVWCSGARDNDFGKLITCRRDALESNPPGSSYGVCMLLGEALVYDQLKRFYLFRIVKTIIFTS